MNTLLLSIILVTSFIKPGFCCSNTSSTISSANKDCTTCSQNALCTISGSSLTCTCKSGFVGDGFICYDETTCSPTCCTYGYSWNGSCCIPDTNCSSPCAQDEICTNTASGWTCLCNKSLYYKDPTLNAKFDCTLKMRIYVLKCQAETLGFNTSTMHLIDPTCTGVESIVGGQRIVAIEFNHTAQECGTTFQSDGSLSFSNVMYIDPAVSVVITAAPKNVTFTCNYPMNLELSLDLAINPTQATASNGPSSIVISGSSSFTVQMLLFKDDSFSSQYAQGAPIALTVETPLYISVRSPDANGLIFALLLKTCYANPSPYGNGSVSFVFIKDFCPVAGVPGLSVIANGASLESRLKFNLFKFVNYPSVYIFCSIQFCDHRSASCIPTCGAKELPEGKGSQDTLVRNGPIELKGMYKL
ncbi:uromodulin-like [Protopterus annectens]|uniref:uromodulin-like n=1 Tax=Protopterus annectens TaxID=7888 RepID=UPI001CFB5093|nr:uromodulin-like [Protopterus annectens]